MTLNKVPNTDDLRLQNLAPIERWVWGGSRNDGSKRSITLETTTNGTITDDIKWLGLATDGTSDEYAEVYGGARIEGRQIGKTVLQLGWGVNGNPEFMNETIEAGFSRWRSFDGQEIAAIQPSSEIFRVDVGGTDTDVDISTALDKPTNHYLSFIIADWDVGEIYCYVDDWPWRDGSSPDATVAPASMPALRGPAVKVHGNGNSGEEARAMFGMLAYIP